MMLYTLSTPDWNAGAPAVRRLSRLARPRRAEHAAADVHEGQERDEPASGRATGASSRSCPIATRRARRRRGAAAGGGGRGGAGGGGGRNQLFVMRLDGGEAKRVTDAREGVSQFSFTKDGKSIVFASGRSDDEQLYTLPIADLWTGRHPEVARS